MNIFVCANSKSEVFKSFFDDAVIADINSMGNAYFADHTLSEEELSELIGGYDVCITCWGSPKISEKVLKNATDLKYIIHTCGSVANIVSEDVYKRGITVLCGNEFFARSVAEGVVAYLLSFLRHIPRISENLRTNGVWESFNMKNNYARSLSGKTVGLVSFGAITKHLIPLLYAHGCKIKLYSRHHIDSDYLKKYDIIQTDLNAIFKTCDIVSLHTSLNEHTKNMITKNQLSLLRDGAIFVNTARAALVCEKDLISEISTGRISAILDIFHSEPLKNPNAFTGRDNVFLMPHMAGPTVELRATITRELLASLKKCVSGEKSPYEVSLSKALEMSRG